VFELLSNVQGSAYPLPYPHHIGPYGYPYPPPGYMYPHAHPHPHPAQVMAYTGMYMHLYPHPPPPHMAQMRAVPGPPPTATGVNTSPSQAHGAASPPNGYPAPPSPTTGSVAEGSASGPPLTRAQRLERYKEKKRTRQFSKKIRYAVRAYPICTGTKSVCYDLVI